MESPLLNKCDPLSVSRPARRILLHPTGEERGGSSCWKIPFLEIPLPLPGPGPGVCPPAPGKRGPHFWRNTGFSPHAACRVPTRRDPPTIRTSPWSCIRCFPPRQGPEGCHFHPCRSISIHPRNEPRRGPGFRKKEAPATCPPEGLPPF